MTSRIRRFALALLLLALPLQGWTAARMVRCPHDITASQASGKAHDAQNAAGSCHERSNPEDRTHKSESPAGSAGPSACHDCGQCQGCFVNVLPTATQTPSTVSPQPLAFPAPAAFAGFIPEHLDPPPLG